MSPGLVAVADRLTEIRLEILSDTTPEGSGITIAKLIASLHASVRNEVRIFLLVSGSTKVILQACKGGWHAMT